MKGIKNWLEKSIVSLCDIALKMQDCAEDQNEINDIIAMRNEMQRRIKSSERVCKDCGGVFTPHEKIPNGTICEACCQHA